MLGAVDPELFWGLAWSAPESARSSRPLPPRTGRGFAYGGIQAGIEEACAS
jgi:hypothetical protein